MCMMNGERFSNRALCDGVNIPGPNTTEAVVVKQEVHAPAIYVPCCISIQSLVIGNRYPVGAWNRYGSNRRNKNLPGIDVDNRVKHDPLSVGATAGFEKVDVTFCQFDRFIR